MTATLLMILKILGIILLCILALVLIIILLVLFVPIRYMYRLRYNDDDSNLNCHYVNITWIFRIIKLKVLISLKGLEYEVRIFGIRCKFIEKLLYNKNDEYEEFENFIDEEENSLEDLKISSDGDESFDDSYEKSILPNSDFYNDQDNRAPEEDDRTLIEKIIDGDLDEILTDGDDIKTSNQVESSLSDNKEERCNHTKKKKTSRRFKFKKHYYTSIRKRIILIIKKIINVLNPINWLKILGDRIVSFIRYIRDITKVVIESIENIIHRISLILEFLDKPSTIRGIEKVKEYVVKTCRHILPRKKKIVLNIGFEDPSKTGELLAVAGVVYPIFGESLEIYPNFSEKEIKASCFIKGRIRGVNVLIIVVKVMRDKAIKRLLYNLNRLKEEL